MYLTQSTVTYIALLTYIFIAHCIINVCLDEINRNWIVVSFISKNLTVSIFEMYSNHRMWHETLMLICDIFWCYYCEHCTKSNIKSENPRDMVRPTLPSDTENFNVITFGSYNYDYYYRWTMKIARASLRNHHRMDYMVAHVRCVLYVYVANNPLFHMYRKKILKKILRHRNRSYQYS